MFDNSEYKKGGFEWTEEGARTFVDSCIYAFGDGDGNGGVSAALEVLEYAGRAAVATAGRVHWSEFVDVIRRAPDQAGVDGFAAAFQQSCGAVDDCIQRYGLRETTAENVAVLIKSAAELLGEVVIPAPHPQQDSHFAAHAPAAA